VVGQHAPGAARPHDDEIIGVRILPHEAPTGDRDSRKS
jgi:hypothetical protein